MRNSPLTAEMTSHILKYYLHQEGFEKGFQQGNFVHEGRKGISNITDCREENSRRTYKKHSKARILYYKKLLLQVFSVHPAFLHCFPNVH